MLVKNKEGFINPTELMIRISYIQGQGHIFTIVSKPPKTLSPFSDKIPQKTEELIVITFDLQNGKIMEISESAQQYLDFFGL